jgi:hypothetical protein
VIGSESGISSWRCHPSAHWCIRRDRARFAHDGQRDSRVEPQGRTTVRASPLSLSTRRRSSGRMQTPSAVARSSTSVLSSRGVVHAASPRPGSSGWTAHRGRFAARAGAAAGRSRCWPAQKAAGDVLDSHERHACREHGAAVADGGHGQSVPRRHVVGVGQPRQVQPVGQVAALIQSVFIRPRPERGRDREAAAVGRTAGSGR